VVQPKTKEAKSRKPKQQKGKAQGQKTLAEVLNRRQPKRYNHIKQKMDTTKDM
jgi:hypothetical protein